MTTRAVRDKKIALVERDIEQAGLARNKHLAHIDRLVREIAALEQKRDWLRDMPVDDPTPAEVVARADITTVTGD